MAAAIINIDLDKKCSRCRKGGATDNGLCLKCITKAMDAGEYDHILKPLREQYAKAVGKAAKKKENEHQPDLFS